jgi:hypothetical protein
MNPPLFRSRAACFGRNCLEISCLDWNGKIIAGITVLFETELPAQAFPSLVSV